MNLLWHPNAWEDYLYWYGQNNKQVIKRIHQLIEDTRRHPDTGLGKPEPLKHDYAGYWSRRITEEHRMVYTVDGNNLILIALRYHY